MGSALTTSCPQVEVVDRGHLPAPTRLFRTRATLITTPPPLERRSVVHGRITPVPPASREPQEGHVCAQVPGMSVSANVQTVARSRSGLGAARLSSARACGGTGRCGHRADVLRASTPRRSADGRSSMRAPTRCRSKPRIRSNPYTTSLDAIQGTRGTGLRRLLRPPAALGFGAGAEDAVGQLPCPS